MLLLPVPPRYEWMLTMAVMATPVYGGCALLWLPSLGRHALDGCVCVEARPGDLSDVFAPRASSGMAKDEALQGGRCGAVLQDAGTGRGGRERILELRGDESAQGAFYTSARRPEHPGGDRPGGVIAVVPRVQPDRALQQIPPEACEILPGVRIQGLFECECGEAVMDEKQGLPAMPFEETSPQFCGDPRIEIQYPF